MAKEPAKKSTSKKKTAAKKKAVEKKKKPAKKTTAKKAVKKTAKPKAKATMQPQKKTASKPKASKSKKAEPKKTSKQRVSIRDLILKKFEKLGPAEVVHFDKPRPARISAPPIISTTDEKEVARIRTLLLKRFDYADLVTAAEKAAAEKAVAEKAVAEKAVAEKAAAEKAAAEKAVAEKAAAEKAVAEKAAAEKAAAEKAAAERAAAEKITVTYNSDDAKGNETMDKTTKILAAAVIGLLLLIGAASMSNMGNYYLKPTDKALEIWRGKFAPKGEKRFVELPGVKAPEGIKSVYTKEEVFPLAFGYYISQADDLLSKKKIPDFAAIKSYLDRASCFAVSQPLKEAIAARLTTLDLMVLMYKAEASATRKTEGDLKNALGYLQEAGLLALSDGQKALIAEKKGEIEASLTAMRKVKARKATETRKANTQKKPAQQHSPS